MSNSYCKVIGIDNFSRSLQNLTEEMGKKIEELVVTESEVLAEDAQAHAPVDTGTLRATVKADKKHGSGAKTWRRVFIDYPNNIQKSVLSELGITDKERSRHYYAFAMEHGFHDAKGVFHQGRPFFNKATEREQERFTKKFNELLNASIEKEGLSGE